MQAESLSAEELLELQPVSDPQVNPDGDTIAYVVSEAFVGFGQPSPESRIWLASRSGGLPAQLTTGPGADDLPRWSPDGRTLSFRSDRATRGEGQLYVMPSAGGAPRLLANVPGGVTAYAWSPDGSRIAAIVVDPAPPRAEGFDEIRYEDDARFARVWLIDVESRAVRQLTSGAAHVWELDWSPDGRALAIISSRLPLRWDWYRARLGRVEEASGEIVELYAPERQIARPRWSPDGSTIAVISCTWSDPGMTGGDVVLVPAAGGAAHNLTSGARQSHQVAYWQSDSRSLVTEANADGRAAICALDLSGAAETIWSDEQSFGGFSLVNRSGRLIVGAASSSLNAPPELWTAELSEEVVWSQLSRHNAPLAGRVPGRLETIHWMADDGLDIHGLLLRPIGAAPARPLPLVVMIHGGPTALWGHAFPMGSIGSWIPDLLARGIAILLPNPRGSAGWGADFSERNQGDLGGGDLRDILAGVDYCVEAGLADPDRLGVCGWSYGGYLTAWAITQTDRFKTAVAGASITNWISFHGTSDIPGFDETFCRADPYAVNGPYVSRSPIIAARQVTTPTLFVHGERDLICPVGQAIEMFRALRATGVPTECVIYPREGHPIRERAHRLDLQRRGVDWLCRILD